jgi:uncharacterized protein YbjT (DUF2867 family)
MILVVGATGQLGGAVSQGLLDRGRPVRVLVRPGSPYQPLVEAGAEPVPGDLKDGASLGAACSGVEAVVTTANSASRGGEDTVETVDTHGNRNLIGAAVAQRVRRFVFVSAWGADVNSPVPLLRAKGETEQHLRDTGLVWTILRPNVFMDVWVPAVVGGPALAGQPVTLVGEGRRRHSFVAVRDVASYTIAALDHAEAEHQILPIGGPQPVSWRDVVSAFEHELGYPVPVRTVASGQPVPGLPDVMTQLITALDAYDSPMDMSSLAQSFGVAPTPLAAFIRAFVATNRN